MIVFNDPIPCTTTPSVRSSSRSRCATGHSCGANGSASGHRLGFGVGIARATPRSARSASTRREYTAIGSVINLASRLCDEARPGQIVIGQRAFSAVEHCVEAATIGDLTLKGFTAPVAAYEVVSWRGELPPPPAGAATAP